MDTNLPTSPNGILIVLTENHFLYAGLSALVPEMECLKVDYSAGEIPPLLNVTRNVIIVVDSLIVFRGEWSTFMALKLKRPDASIVWYLREETGRFFPAGSDGERILTPKQDIHSLQTALRQTMKKVFPLENVDYLRAVRLTPTERNLLPLFLSGLSLSAMERLTGKRIKTLYAHRAKIMSKTGFRQLTFMKIVYERNTMILNTALLSTEKNVQHEACTSSFLHCGIHFP